MGKGSNRRPKFISERELDRRWALAFFPEDWAWPVVSDSRGWWWLCPCGQKHGAGKHECDGCCGHPSFPLNKRANNGPTE